MTNDHDRLPDLDACFRRVIMAKGKPTAAEEWGSWRIQARLATS